MRNGVNSGSITGTVPHGTGAPPVALRFFLPEADRATRAKLCLDTYVLLPGAQNSRTTGRENQLHLVLYKKVDVFLPGLTTEAAAAMLSPFSEDVLAVTAPE